MTVDEPPPKTLDHTPSIGPRPEKLDVKESLDKLAPHTPPKENELLPPKSYAARRPSSDAPVFGQNAEAFFKNYRLGKTLGVGSFGKVKVAEHVLTGHKVAIKILNRRKIAQMEMGEKVQREIKILSLFMHPHISRLYEVVETLTDIYVVMEYVRAGELFDYIVGKGRLDEDEARHFFQQILSGVEYCHRHMVVHRDLKPENLLLDGRSSVKIADFGLSNVMRDGHFLRTSCGSPNYAAPEVICGRAYEGPEVDVWSLGVILYALLCGKLPFDDESIPILFNKIKRGMYVLPNHLSPGASDLIPRMLLVDPLKRITISEIRGHPWFQAHLPRYIACMQTDAALTAPRIDEPIVREVVKLGFDRTQLLADIRARRQTSATVSYFLMLDNRHNMLDSGYLRDELTEAAQQALLRPTGIMRCTPQQPNCTLGRSLPKPQPAASATSCKWTNERRWRLGIHARGHPSAIMAELYDALTALNVSWKKLSPYNLKCCYIRPPRTQPSRAGTDTSSSSTSSSGASELVAGDLEMERSTKFELQVYRVRDGHYVIDFQRLSGDLFVYMDIGGDILSALRL